MTLIYSIKIYFFITLIGQLVHCIWSNLNDFFVKCDILVHCIWSNLNDLLSNVTCETLPVYQKEKKAHWYLGRLYKFKGARWSLDRWCHRLHCPSGCPLSSEIICCWICCSQRARQSRESRSWPWQRALFGGRGGELCWQEPLSLREAVVGSRPTLG